MTSAANWFAAAVLGLFVGACAPGSQVQHAPAMAEESATQVEVTNNNWSDMRVYIERSGIRTRLGTVTSMSKQVFRIPESLVSAGGSVRLIADPIGGRQMFISPAVHVTQGQRMELTIQNHLSISSVSIWNR